MKYPSVHPHQVAKYLDGQDEFVDLSEKKNILTDNKDEQPIQSIQAADGKPGSSKTKRKKRGSKSGK